MHLGADEAGAGEKLDLASPFAISACGVLGTPVLLTHRGSADAIGRLLVKCRQDLATFGHVAKDRS